MGGRRGSVARAVVVREAERVPGGLPRARRLLGQLARYAAVSGFATAVNAGVFLLLRTWWTALPANLVALVLSTAVSTEINRRFTFGGASVSRWRGHVQKGGTGLVYAGV